MRLYPRRFLFLLSFCFVPSLLAQDQSGGSTVSEPANKPYEVVVTPGTTRAGLRILIERVEEDMFARFNELNDDDEYDIACYKYTPTMSHITQRVCEPFFMLSARNLMASEVTFLLGSGSVGARNSTFAMPPETMRREKKPDYEVLQTKMEEFTSTDMEFRSIAESLLELRARLANFGSEQ